MKRIFVLFTLLCASLMLSAVHAQDELPETVVARDLEIDLGDDFTTQAQLTFPAEGDGPFPTVILVHGSGPFDMDATYFTAPGEEPLSANFRLLVERLGEAGIAVLRYNKRGVLGDGEYDMDQVQSSTLDRLVADTETVLDAALEQPEVDVNQIYLYGWSEGAWVVTNVAVNRPENVAGLILHGAANGDLSTVLAFQWLETSVTFLSETTDADGDGMLTLDEIATIPAGPVGYMASFFLYDMTSTPEEPVINSFVDQNDDEQIDIYGELLPLLEQYVQNFPQFLPETEASYEIAQLVQILEKPVLVLHGELDGWVPVSNAEAISDAAPGFATLNVYPELGHALSPTESFAEDSFGVMDDAPIEDLIAWVEAQQ